MILNKLLCGIAVACAAPLASAQFLLVVESSNDTVMQVSAVDGSIVNATYIDLSVAGASTPIEAIVVNDEIWVSDQLLDGIMRFSLDGTTWLGNITGGMDNVRGIEFANGEIFVSNSGTGNGAPGDALVRLSPAGVNLGFYPVGDPFDVLDFQGGLLVNNISNDSLVTMDYAGVLGPVFHDSDGINGIDFCEQTTLRSNGNVLAAGFSAPAGIYEYDPTGVQLNYYSVGSGLRGVHELGNGHILWTNGSGVHSYDPVGDVSTTIVASVSGRFITPFAGANPAFTVVCPGDGTGAACPCANNSPVGAGEGCLHSFGIGGKLRATGDASLAADTVVLQGTQLPDSPALYFQGTALVGAGAGVAFGDGLRCVGGTVVRLKTVTSVGSASQYPEAGDPSVSVRGMIAAPGTRNYQAWFRNAAAFCTAATFNLTNALEIVWGP